MLDEALAGFLPDGEDALVDHPRVIHVRSFSKAHAMAGFRVGYAIVPDGTPTEPLAPVYGVGAAALAGALWAVENGAARGSRAPRGGGAGSGSGWPRVRSPSRPATARTPGSRPAACRSPRSSPRGGSSSRPGRRWGDDGHVRVTLRDAPATDRLLEALREIAEGAR